MLTALDCVGSNGLTQGLYLGYGHYSGVYGTETFRLPSHLNQANGNAAKI